MIPPANKASFSRGLNDRIEQGDSIELIGIKEAIQENLEDITVTNLTKNITFKVRLSFSPREKEALLAGGIINLIRSQEGN